MINHKIDKNLINEVNKNIVALNETGQTFIFMVTGLNSSGKTLVSKLLSENLNIYQTIHLGIITKLLKYHYGFSLDELENTPNKKFDKKVNFFLDKLIFHYSKNGVNTLIEGVQLSPEYYTKNSYILGGVILNVDSETLEFYGKYPITRFKRRLSKDQLPVYQYETTHKFYKVSNYDLINTLNEILNIINNQIKFQLEQNQFVRPKVNIKLVEVN